MNKIEISYICNKLGRYKLFIDSKFSIAIFFLKHTICTLVLYVIVFPPLIVPNQN